MKKEEEISNRYLQFSLGGELYCIHLLTVKEVIPIPETTKLPNGNDYHNGVMNLRGQIISIMDLRKKLKIKPGDAQNQEAVIIVNLEGLAIGLIVDSINKVMNIDLDAVADIPEISSQINSQYIDGVFHSDEAMSIILNLSRVLDVAKIKNYQAIA